MLPRARRGAALRQIRARGAAGTELSPTIPIETALTPQALRVNKIDIGMRVAADLRRGTTIRRVPEESLMLTGDENIVDVDFSVLWKIKPNGVGDYLFNIQQPEGTVKAVAESATREVVGRSNIQPILTGARQNIETGMQDLMQSVLDKYGAGIQITQAALLEDEQLDTIECESAEAALAIMLIGGQHVVMILADIILADIRLHGVMDGIDLAHEVRVRWPLLPIVLTSGHPLERMREFPPGVAYIAKPWQPLNLLVAAEEALASLH
jgi:CheY-like chemotaxis protein